MLVKIGLLSTVCDSAALNESLEAIKMPIYPFTLTHIIPVSGIFPMEITQNLGKTYTQKWAFFLFVVVEI